MRLNLILLLCVYLVGAIGVSAFVGGFFGIPQDPESFVSEMRSAADVANRREIYTESQFRDLMERGGDSPGARPPEVVDLYRSLHWRPWIIIPFVFAVLIIARPLVATCSISITLVSIAALAIGAKWVAVFLAGCGLGYILIHTLLKRGPAGRG